MLGFSNAASRAGRSATALSDESAVTQPDTVSPHDQDALKALAETWERPGRLPNLIRGADRSRGLAKVHMDVARRFVRAARLAEELGDRSMRREHLNNAWEARRKALECYQFARRCERTADALAGSSGAAPKPRRR